jgi:hypothetical protein
MNVIETSKQIQRIKKMYYNAMFMENNISHMKTKL